MTRKVGIIGLGYAGLHTALAFGKIKKIVGFDVNKERVSELSQQFDRHNDFHGPDFIDTQIMFTADLQKLNELDFYIVIVPTPITAGKNPDFSYLIDASKLVGGVLKKGDIVVYESTVYPGATEEVCLPILEKTSGLQFGKDFTIGYSPERINPGDKLHTFINTPKVVSGSDQKTLQVISEEYSQIVTAGIYPTSTIKTAEAIKIMENIQRDVNIALMNELAQSFQAMGVNCEEAINGAKTKWNFLPFSPGLVGGHCIGVDPYYLIYRANTLNASVKLMTAAREVNETMSKFITETLIKNLVNHHLLTNKPKVAILGITYKENFDDVRNTKVVDLVHELESYGIEILIYDPIADKKSVMQEYGIKLADWKDIPLVSAIIIAVAHDDFKKMRKEQYTEKFNGQGLIFDLKNTLNRKAFESSTIKFIQL